MNETSGQEENKVCPLSTKIHKLVLPPTDKIRFYFVFFALFPSPSFPPQCHASTSCKIRCLAPNLIFKYLIDQLAPCSTILQGTQWVCFCFCCCYFVFKPEQSFSKGRNEGTAHFSSLCHRNTKHVDAHCNATQFPLLEHALSKRLLVAQRACAIKLDPFSYQTSNIPTLKQHHSKSGN